MSCRNWRNHDRGLFTEPNCMIWPSVSNVFNNSLVATQPISFNEFWMIFSEFSIERVNGMVTCNVIDSHDWLIMDMDTLNTSLYASGGIIIPYGGHKYILFTQHPVWWRVWVHLVENHKSVCNVLIWNTFFGIH